MFEIIKINGKDYMLKLTAKTTVLMEKKIGKNPLIIFMGMEKGNIPSLEETLVMFYCSLQKHHADDVQTEEAAYDLYDEYVDEGGTMFDLLEILSDVVLNAGFKPKEQEQDEKN